MQDPSSPRLILVLQSDPAHGQFIQSVLGRSELNAQMVAIADTQEALHFLQRRGQHTLAPRPDLILLDLDLSGNDHSGHDLLASIKSDASLRRIPVIVLTLSDSTEDIFRTYAMQGNCYVIRPGDREHLTQTIHRIEEFWLNIVTLPQE